MRSVSHSFSLSQVIDAFMMSDANKSHAGFVTGDFSDGFLYHCWVDSQLLPPVSVVAP